MLAILQALDQVMARLGWTRQDLYGMGSAYAKDQPVTPYYLPRLQGRAGRRYLVASGYVGVIHRRFEDQWLEGGGRKRAKNHFPVIRLIANFPDLNEISFIEPDHPLPEQMHVFGGAVARLLESLPGDESALVAAFEANVLCGKRLDFSFVSIANDKKFQAFRQFVGQLALERRPELRT